MAKVFTSLQRQNLSEQVVQHLGLSIMRNDLKSGDTLLSEPELSLQFNVSRPILQEALRMLRVLMQLTLSSSIFPRIYNSTPRYVQPPITNFCKRSKTFSVLWIQML
jgi:DNA-binding transcriptional MocR family regulator